MPHLPEALPAPGQKRPRPAPNIASNVPCVHVTCR
nr:MAG TPA: hypothetical protein [Caudoviricetes sp.]